MICQIHLMCVCFDAEMSKLTNVPAVAESKLMAAGQEDPKNMAFHNASQMVGKTFTFQLKLTDFNLSASISLSRSHAYLIPTITHHFLILFQVTTTQAMTCQELVLIQKSAQGNSFVNLKQYWYWTNLLYPSDYEFLTNVLSSDLNFLLSLDELIIVPFTNS